MPVKLNGRLNGERCHHHFIQHTAEGVPMPFGRHRGRPLGEVPTAYLRWLAAQRPSRSHATLWRQMGLVLQRRAALQRRREAAAEQPD